MRRIALISGGSSGIERGAVAEGEAFAEVERHLVAGFVVLPALRETGGCLTLRSLLCDAFVDQSECVQVVSDR